MGDFNLALVIVAIFVCVLVFLFTVYRLVNFQHPDDANQVYLTKFVVVLGLSVAAISILMLPVDVSNLQACQHAIYNGACNLTLPMKDLWLAIYILDAILVFFVIPFAMFSEGNQDKLECCQTDEKCIDVGGNNSYCMRSGAGNFIWSTSQSGTSLQALLPSQVHGTSLVVNIDNCSAYTASASSETTWSMRTTFPEYVVTLATIVGSVLFTIFGVGITCLPLRLIFSFIRRPKAVIARSHYIKEATELGKKARELKKSADALHQEERSGSKGRKWPKNVKAVEKELLLLLEEDVKALEEMYPQGEEARLDLHKPPESRFIRNLHVHRSAWFDRLTVSVAWVAHIVIYLLINPPLSPFLNDVFIKLDDIWGLLDTGAFAFFCFYLLLAVIAGAMMLGLRLVFITIHPTNVIQFCATAFAYYAQATAAQEIFGHTLQSLRGIKYLYNYNVFQIALIALAGLTFVYLLPLDGEEENLAAGSSFPVEACIALTNIPLVGSCEMYQLYQLP
ncbi:LMBR1-like membrane protein [Actinidia rufa]|uniref:LMBR1-like membrane protein n=1 Tax=Actinidia rufa TaxID=165716 RepID=A0A7J0E8W3_9ERIC|nr:LMBR1-like membrane protein [Actinidia rufa]